MESALSESWAILLVIMVAAFLAPLASDHLKRWLVVPAVVLEIAFGIVLGPAGLGVVQETESISLLAEIGLAMLMFMAGYEINFARIKGRPARHATLAWLCSVGLGLALAWAAFGFSQTTLVVGLALTTTALGTVLPILRDAGVLGTAFGTRFLASGTVGEFGPIVLVSLLLSGFRPLSGTLVLAAFLAVAALAAWRATHPRSERLGRLLRATLGTSAQLAVRMCMLVIILMVWIASSLHLDAILGAFAAGVIVRLLVATNHPEEVGQVESKLDAVAYGLFIPVFFVVTGVRFDLGALLSAPVALLLVPMFLLLFLAVRGGPELLFLRGDVPAGQRAPLVLMSATALPMVVVLTTIGTDSGALDPVVAASLVGAGMLSVLVLPQVSAALLRRP